MKKRNSRILMALVIIALIGSAFPHVKETVEIRSETRKWVEKWEERVETPAETKMPELAKAKRVPKEIKQNQTLDLAGSPWVVNSHVVIHEGATLSVEPGVEIFIAPMADIQVYGKILVRGEQENPVRLTSYSKQTEDAWAGIFIRSDQPSEFKYAKFENSRYGARLVYSSSSWEHCTFNSVREICSGFKSNFSFKACMFDYREYIGSGNINVMKFYKGFAQVEDSDFFAPNSDYKVDGIDADYMSSAVFRGNRFFGGKCENSDAIDIGHGSTNIIIENNLIVGFIDKAISVGEKAQATISNNVIVGCAIGVGVKDSGRASITRTTFDQNDYAVKAYEKVPGLGGGDVKVDSSVMTRSKKSPVEADALSSIKVSKTLCDSQLLPGDNNVQGVPEFEDVLNRKYNLKTIHGISGSKLEISAVEFGAKL